MLEIIKLSKAYKQKKVVDSINLYLDCGETVGLLGPNGAGKSTTISLISSLVQPSGGDVRLHNESILKSPQSLREILGVVPQEIALYMDLSARENLIFFGKMHRISNSSLQKRVDEVLDIIGLKDREKDLVKTFSGGMKRRLNIGVALIHEPKIIIMDEPTVGIDPQSRNYILETVKKLNKEQNMTVLYTSHYMEEVEFLCDRIYIMDHGQIIASGTKEELKNILSQETAINIKVELIKHDFVEALKSQDNVKNLSIQQSVITIIVPKQVNMLKNIFKIAEEHTTNVLSVNIVTPTLEDVFLHLTGRQLRD
ncbi:ABC transporter ATP-binding protein [Niallia sp. NCCP-28]|uniref:ABC transporter ATP-binding protein n=1 Tax=Niallia sp. NCCP-28 TaxID=2934712 RepID=UPI0020894F0B|nr:ABC transporter ATP-binding protein [Niallia sp. NCCP-28]GKU81736.1 antibiotic ABC transporter ATP-binding protein [Niallia sp. NCCP-28]